MSAPGADRPVSARGKALRRGPVACRVNAPDLSGLGRVPVRDGQTSAQAVAASLDTAAHADRLGYLRYWFAEHHNMPAVASTTPPVLIAAAAARTERIRVGSGGEIGRASCRERVCQYV